jgi:hypothetical protein
MFQSPRTNLKPRKRERLEYPFRPKPYVPTEKEIAAAISILQYLPRRKSVNPNCCTYVDLKGPIEKLSREYVSAWAVVRAAERLGFAMHYSPSRHSARLNVPQRAVKELRRRAGLDR